MIKNTLATAALLGLVDAIQVKYLSENPVQQLTELGAQEQYPTDEFCNRGIERFTSGPSNSWTAFSNSQRVNTSWEDPEFLADDSSILWEDLAERLGSPGFDWIRPPDMGGYDDRYEASPKLYGSYEKARPNGVDQGGLGDCWFLAAASAVAEVPERIERILWNKEYNKQGAFRWYFWIKNGWYGINIDDRIPSRKYGDDMYRPFAASPSKAGAWWFPLLEKAYAKLDQNYQRLAGGNGEEGLRTLTGMPTYQYQFRGCPYLLWRKEDYFPLHKYYASKNYPMTAACCFRRGGGSLNGLIDNHAYTLLDAKSVQYNGEELWLAKMRNPWNNEHYTGPWRDNDPNWTDAMKEELGWEQSNDGIFWMPYDLYFDTFYTTSVTFYDKYEVFEQMEVTLNQGWVGYFIDNPVNQHWYITVEDYSRRHYPRAKKCVQNMKGTYVGLNAVDPATGHTGQNFVYNHLMFRGRGAGFSTVGSIHQRAMAPGVYHMPLANDDPLPKDVTFNIYWEKTKGRITKQNN